MNHELSAGGVIFRKNKRKFEVLLLKDQRDEWTFPKGLVEEGEDKVKTAEREINEEVGLSHIRFLDTIAKIQYMYKRDGSLISKDVFYFLFEATESEKLVPQKEEGIQEVRWFSLEKAKEIIGYKKTNEEVLKSAIEKMRLLD